MVAAAATLRLRLRLVLKFGLLRRLAWARARPRRGCQLLLWQLLQLQALLRWLSDLLLPLWL